MALTDYLKRLRIGRPRGEPARHTETYPSLQFIGQPQSSDKRRFVYKPTPRNLRYFSKTVYARRAINAIKNPIAMLEWEIVPVKGVKMNSELQRQIDAVTFCLQNPNLDDSWRSLIEQVVEDILCGAGAIEQQVGGDPMRPLWLWPTDGLSIQIFAGWTGDPSEARYMQTIGYGSMVGANQGVQLRNDELIYIRPNPSTPTPFGLGPLEVAFLHIARKLSVEDYSGNVAGNARPSAGLYAGDKVDMDGLKAMRLWWKNDIEGQGQFPIFGGSEKPAVLNFLAEGDKGLYIEYQQLLGREIAAAFDLSPQNFGIQGDVNRNVSEVAQDRDWDQAIKPAANLVASQITREAIQGRLGFSQLRFKFIGLDREDEKSTADINKLYFEMNVFTPNIILDRLGMPAAKNMWGDMTSADVQIAISAARGAKAIDDTDLQPLAPAASPQTIAKIAAKPTPSTPAPSK